MANRGQGNRRLWFGRRFRIRGPFGGSEVDCLDMSATVCKS